MNNPVFPQPQFTYPIFDGYETQLFHGTYRDLQNSPHLLYPVQVHGNEVEKIDFCPTSPPQCDALITQNTEILLAIQHADCQAAILFDPVTKSLGVVHAGWKGLVKNIYKKTVQAMQNAYSVRPENLLVAIAPSLGPKNSQFLNYKTEFPESFWPYQEPPFYFNLRKIALDLLADEGVLKERIFIEKTDTFENTLACHSYRRNKTALRMATLAQLIPQT